MKVIINDTLINLSSSTMTLEQAVLNSGVTDFRGLAVAVNNKVIPRINWGTFNLNENDTITIIHATQGG